MKKKKSFRAASTFPSILEHKLQLFGLPDYMYV